MKLAINPANLSISQLKWLIYPLAVCLFVVLTQRWLWLGADSLWNRISLARVEVGKNSLQASGLSTKLTALQKIDMVSDGELLKKLNQAVPGNKDLNLLVSEMQLLSASTQIPISAFKGMEDYTMSITFDTPDFPAATNLLTEMYKSLPLLSIQQVNYSPGKVIVEVKGEFRALPQIETDSELPVPDYRSKAAAATTSLRDFKSTDTATQEFVPSLPLSANPF